MDRIVGVVPAGGKARRIHGFFKEMMPIGIDEKDKSKFVVSSQEIIGSMFTGGASAVHFILSSQKGFVGDYYGKQHIFDGRINFNYLTEAVEDLGMPYTIDSVYDQLSAFDYVLMGMPDTVIEPTSSFSTLHSLLRQKKADLALGIYRTDSRNRGGFIRYDRTSKQVTSHVDKTAVDFPAHADNSWAIACWTRKFTEFIHDFLERDATRACRPLSSPSEELLFGDLISAAIKNPALHIVGDFIDEKNGFYWDITEPEKYFDLLRHYFPADNALPFRPGSRWGSRQVQSAEANKVFIGHGHSDCWKRLRDFLHDRLSLVPEEFNRIPQAGISTQERLREMLESVGFAFLVMTGEEERAGGKLAARDNVIHEIGLFEGKLGSKRAVILLEEDCLEFSNITGLSQIRFPKGDLMAKSEEIRRVLEREGLLKTKD